MRSVCASCLLLITAVAPASAKLICPPGRYTIQVEAAGSEPALEGAEIVLGRGTVAVTGRCAPVAASRYLRVTGVWANTVRARWGRCDRRRPVKLKAAFRGDGPLCMELVGTIRIGRGRPIPLTADRVPECGNGLREPGEECDPQARVADPCCGADCRVGPGCPLACESWFPCPDDHICARNCILGAICKPRAGLDCGQGPVCACDGVTEYADACAAWEAGTGPLHPAPCR